MKSFTLLLLTLLYLNASANSLIIQDDKKYENFSLGFFKDSQNTFSFEQIQQKEFTKGKSNFALGYLKDGVVWFKVDVTNQTQTENFILSVGEHFYETVELYYKNSHSLQYTQKENNLFIPVKDREIKSTTISFELPLAPNDTTTIYIKIKGKYAYFGNITLYPQSNSSYNSLLSVSSLYLYVFGILTIIMVFSLFLFIRMKEKIYGYYLGFSFFNLFYVLNISGLFGYIGLEAYIYKFYFSAPFMVAFLMLFSMEFLDIKKYLPRVNKILYLFPLFLFISGIISIFYYEPWNKIITNALAICVIILIILAPKAYFMGHTKSKYYIIAVVLYFLGGFIFLFMIKGSIEYSFFTRYILFFCIPIEATIFTLMLADRYYDMKKQQVETQKRLIQQKKNYHKNLEIEVKEKTKKLTHLLKERETLLKEIQHRVKNNFHSIISILSLGKMKNKIESPEYDEAIHRIVTMSQIHQELYHSSYIGYVDTKKYLVSIIQKVSSIFTSIELQTDIEKHQIDFDTATVLGTIINELITNSFKHNLPNSKLTITLTFKRKNNSYEFLYCDDGKGFDLNSVQKGLGISLITKFSDKLRDAHFSYDSEINGVCFKLNFTPNPKNTHPQNE